LDTEVDIIPTGESSVGVGGDPDDPEHILYQQQHLEREQPSQRQFFPEEVVEDERKPSPKDLR
jgi:hypothetical protein